MEYDVDARRHERRYEGSVDLRRRLRPGHGDHREPTDQPELGWRCVAGHEPWQDSAFRFRVATLDDGRTRLRFWQDYSVELEDDYFGVYNFNWGYYLESLRLLCVTGSGRPFAPA